MSDKPDTCLGCPLYKAPGPVWGHGPESAKMFLVGEAPGEDETHTLKPFTGGSGRILYRQCSLAGIRRDEECFVSNVVKCRPTFTDHLGRLKDRPPTEEEIRHCGRYLVEEVRRVKANILVLLGNTALRVFTGKDKISTYRGVPMAAGDRKVLATFHPAYIMRSPHEWPVPVIDLVRAKRESAFPEVVRQPVDYNISPVPGTDGPSLLSAVLARGYCPFDLETSNLDPRTSSILCIGLSRRPYQAECYNWTGETHAVTQAIMGDPRIEKVGQNSESFDIPFLECKGIAFAGPSFDTMLAFHLTNPDLPKNLANISTYTTDMEPWKNESMYKSGFDALKLGNCKDVDATDRSYVQLRGELAQLDMLDLYYKHVMPLQPVLRRMSARGMKKDEMKAVAWSIAMNNKARELEAVIKEGIGADFDLNSPKQLISLFYDKMGLPKQWKRDKNGQRLTVDADAMEALAVHTKSPLFHMIRKVRTLDKFRATFLNVEADEESFVHPRFGCAKAANGRLNSWDPNAQNVPLELREIYVPDGPEDVIIAADWSQVERRVATVLSGDKAGLEMLASGRDIHYATAATVLSKPYDQVTSTERHNAKFVVYGLDYGRGAASIAETYGLDLAFVEKFIGDYSRQFHTFWKWREGLVKTVEAQSYLVNPFKRRRWWYGRQVTEIYNFPASSTAAGMMYEVLPILEKQLPRGATLRLTVHDETVVNCHRSLAKTVRDCLRSVMEKTWPQITAASQNEGLVKAFYPDGWFCPVEVHMGKNWKEAKKGNVELEGELWK